MQISVWLPLGVQIPDLERRIWSAVGDDRQHPIKVENKPQDIISVQIHTCDFDPIGKMHDIVSAVVSELGRAVSREYEVICKAITAQGTLTGTEPRYIGVTA